MKRNKRGEAFSEADAATECVARRRANMFYVYILQSINNPEHFYMGYTNDLKRRLLEHNAGHSIHTNKFTPWEIKNYFAFKNEQKALDFEKYLKSQSGREFIKKHF